MMRMVIILNTKTLFGVQQTKKCYLTKCGENLIHHILLEEELYNHFLNERQLSNCKHVIENEPDSIYRPDLEDEEISDAEYELEEKASETLDDIYASALEFTEDKFWDYDFFEGFSE